MSEDEPNNPSKYVTNAQCIKQVEAFQTEIKTIKTALVGADMRGGIVRDIADIKSTVKRKEKSAELSTKWKITIYGTAITTVGLIIVELLKLLATVLG